MKIVSFSLAFDGTLRSFFGALDLISDFIIDTIVFLVKSSIRHIRLIWNPSCMQQPHSLLSLVLFIFNLLFFSLALPSPMLCLSDSALPKSKRLRKGASPHLTARVTVRARPASSLSPRQSASLFVF